MGSYTTMCKLHYLVIYRSLQRLFQIVACFVTLIISHSSVSTGLRCDDIFH